jgi:hypothetical protein
VEQGSALSGSKDATEPGALPVVGVASQGVDDPAAAAAGEGGRPDKPKNPPSAGDSTGGDDGRRGATVVQRVISVSTECDEKAVRSALKSNLGAMTECYRRRLKFAPAMEGKISMRWVIDLAGQVKGTLVLEDTVEDDVLVQCVDNVIHGINFPLPNMGFGQIEWEFEFKIEER